eukprot:9939445-Lingulodinium_polyedra.AAC.1
MAATEPALVQAVVAQMAFHKLPQAPIMQLLQFFGLPLESHSFFGQLQTLIHGCLPNASPEQ